MMRKLLLLFILITISATPIYAQTHAEATSQKWQGVNVDTILNNSDPDKYVDDNLMTSGFPILLYNVGTGRFVVQGGDWAMEGRLFYQDFGRTMYLYRNGRINSGLTENGIEATKNCFCCRPPEPFNKTWSDNTYSTANLTTLMDGAIQNGRYDQLWHFERVAGETGDTCTYYMYQQSNKQYNVNPATSQYSKYAGMNFYLGAAWGECHNTSVGKGDGRFVFMDDDRSCWTTEDVRGNTNKLQLENGDEVEIQKLYQWRIISLDEFIRVLNGEGVGLNPSISALIPDRDFTRNSDDFYEDPNHPDWTNKWTASKLSDYTYAAATKRYPYTWGDYRTGQSSVKNNNQQSRRYPSGSTVRLVNELWDSPVRLKAVFDKVTSTSNDDQATGKKSAKFGFLEFEGVGTVTTNFQVPQPGWYQLECVGFSMCENDHDAYFFARVIPDSRINDLENTFTIPSADEPHYGVVTMEKLPFGTYTKESYESCKAAGQELLYNADNHRQKVWVQVSQADWDAGIRTIRLGFRKDHASQSAPVTATYNNTQYTGYYDTDWLCADDLRATYMGLSPAFFYEDEEDLTYLSHDPEDREKFSANEYVPTTLDGRYGGAASLQRSFTKNEWNTFSFLLPLTGEQVRYAFGDDSELLQLNQVINSRTKSDCVIDFTTVNLLTLDHVVEPGKLYMLKPSKDPSFGENPRGEKADFYDLGKMFFSTNPADASDPDYDNPVIDLSVWSGNQSFGSIGGTNPGTAYITYTQTPGFETFRVTRQGIYSGSVAPADSYAPKGSYAMSKGKMYELSRDTRIKGFRGWITLAHSIFDSPEEAAGGARIAVNGIIDGDDPISTSIDKNLVTPVNVRAITGIYDLTGRRVGNSVEHLPKGLYIVSGKKLLIK